VIYNDILV